MAFPLSSRWRKFFLVIDGVVLTLLGALVFLTLAGFYVFSREEFGKMGVLITVGIVALTLFLVVSGVALARMKLYGGLIAAVLFGLGLVSTFSSYILSRDYKLLVTFFFYVLLVVLLALGWKELRR